MPCSEVNSLELEFLFSINFSLGVPTDVYERYYVELATHAGVGVPAEMLPTSAPAGGVAPAPGGGVPPSGSGGLLTPGGASCLCCATVGPYVAGTGPLGGLSFSPEEILHTGIRSPEALFGPDVLLVKGAAAAAGGAGGEGGDIAMAH